MAGEEFTAPPVLNSQRTVSGFPIFVFGSGFPTFVFGSVFFSQPVRHKHKANKAMKVGFIDYPLMNPLGLRRLPLLFADILDRVQMNECAFLVAHHDIKKPVPIHIPRGHLGAHA